MRKFVITFLLAALATALLSACSSKPGDEKAVEDYLNALVSKDATQLSTLSCGGWEDQALLELDSFQAVDTKLEDMACSKTGSDGPTSLVLCTGKIVATYNGENQELDLSSRTYQVVQENGAWLVCGVR